MEEKQQIQINYPMPLLHGIRVVITRVPDLLLPIQADPATTVHVCVQGGKRQAIQYTWSPTKNAEEMPQRSHTQATRIAESFAFSAEYSRRHRRGRDTNTRDRPPSPQHVRALILCTRSFPLMTFLKCAHRNSTPDQDFGPQLTEGFLPAAATPGGHSYEEAACTWRSACSKTRSAREALV